MRQSISEQEGTLYLTEEQQLWVDMQRHTKYASPVPYVPNPTERQWLRRLCLRVANSTAFDVFVMCMIVASVVLLSTTYADMQIAHVRVQEVAEIFFQVVFTVEAIIKIYALTPKAYFSLGWNILDFVVVCVGYVTIITEYASDMQLGSYAGQKLRIFRLLRLSRFFRLAARHKGIVYLFEASLVTIPAMFNLTLIFTIIVFTYANIGKWLFGHIRYQGVVSEERNFRSFFKAVYLMFQVSPNHK